MRYQTTILITALVMVITGSCTEPASEEASFTPLFNGVDLSGWVPVNTAPDTWSVRDSMIVCSGYPTGIMRTERHYENYILELEWRHVEEGGNAGLFLHTDALPNVGSAFPRTFEAQILDGNPGDLFGMQGAVMDPNPGTARPDRDNSSRPQEDRIRPLGEWNHYRVESRDGTLTLAINGEVVAGGSGAIPRKGYICLESEGAEVYFRNIRIMELPSTDPAPFEVATEAEGFESLYTGVDFSGWTMGANEAWVVDNYRFNNDPGKGRAELWYDGPAEGDYTLFFDWRIEDEQAPSQVGTFYLRGSNGPAISAGVAEAAPQDEPSMLVHATVEPEQWYRTTVSVSGNHVTIIHDQDTVFDADVDLPSSGPVGFVVEGALMRITNVFRKSL